MPNKKTKIILAIAIAEFILLVLSVVHIIMLVNKMNDMASPTTAYSGVDPTLTLNDGKFYYNSDTDSIYYEVKNGCIQLVFTEENYKEYIRKTSPNISENSIDGTYNWNVEFWEEPRPYNVWVWYTDPPESDIMFLSFEVLEIEMYNRIVPAPGVGWNYIDKNNFGSDSGPVFTRV